MSLPINLGNLPLLLDETSADLQLPPVSDEEFYEFCLRNPLLNVERTAKGTLHFMPPVTAWVDSRGGELFADLVIWNRALPTPGFTFDGGVPASKRRDSRS
jgi:Uma2 family endonuclease